MISTRFPQFRLQTHRFEFTKGFFYNLCTSVLHFLCTWSNTCIRTRAHVPVAQVVQTVTLKPQVDTDRDVVENSWTAVADLERIEATTTPARKHA